jgi:hypothetical protein
MKTYKLLLILVLILAACNDEDICEHGTDENGNCIEDTVNNDTLYPDDTLNPDDTIDPGDTLSYFDTICQSELCVGDVFELKYGHCTTIIDSANKKSFEVCFSDVEEGRCWWENCYLCDLGGIAYIYIDWIDEQSDTVSLTLEIWGCDIGNETVCNSSYYTDTLDYRFCVMRLLPYPESSKEVVDSDYIARIKIAIP